MAAPGVTATPDTLPFPTDDVTPPSPPTTADPVSAPAEDAAPAYKHPGFEWLDDAACGPVAAELEAKGLSPLPMFFVEAGHVISEDTLNMCRACPVRVECLLHAYLGGPGGTPIIGGYMGGFSLGQRKAMTLEQALERAKNDPPRAPKPRRGN